MLNGSIKKYTETVRTTSYSYPNYYNGYEGMYDDNDGKYESLADQYAALQAAKNAAIAKGFHRSARVTILNTGQTGVVEEFAISLKDGVDLLGNYMPIGVKLDARPNSVIFYTEAELELIP